MLVSVVSPANAIVFPSFGGLLHVHCPAAATILEPRLSVVASATLPVVFLHVVSGGSAKTIQFPHKSLNGFGTAVPTLYGPKHIAIPSHKVSVGTRYNLN